MGRVKVGPGGDRVGGTVSPNPLRNVPLPHIRPRLVLLFISWTYICLTSFHLCNNTFIERQLYACPIVGAGIGW